MPTDYTKKKNAELEDLLKARNLPHTGKKAELVARLQQHDAEEGKKAPSKPTAAAAGEDEIDWEDDAAAATSQTGAAAIAAGGVGQPANPPAVPNQKVDTDPSTTNDLKANSAAPTKKQAKATDGSTTTTATAPTETTDPPPPDFASGLEQTSLDAELAKRQKRAARFGVQETDAEALKALERAKKFGIDSTKAVSGLDQALPERSRKRGRGGDEGGKRDGKRSRVRGDEGKRERVPAKGLSEKDRLAAEARKKRFAAA